MKQSSSSISTLHSLLFMIIAVFLTCMAMAADGNRIITPMDQNALLKQSRRYRKYNHHHHDYNKGGGGFMKSILRRTNINNDHGNRKMELDYNKNNNRYIPDNARVNGNIHNCQKKSIIEDLRVALCGGLAGATGTMVLYPFDTAKTLRQSEPQKYRNVYSALKSLYSSSSSSLSRSNRLIQGTRLAYSGVWTSTLGAIPSSALYFGGYEFAKRRLEKVYLVHAKKNICRLPIRRPSSPRTNALNANAVLSHTAIEMKDLSVFSRLCIHAMAAASGNAISSFIFVPKEYIKQQYQSQGRGLQTMIDVTASTVATRSKGFASQQVKINGNSAMAATSAAATNAANSACTTIRNKSMHKMIYEVVRSKGIKELYTGYRATLMRNVPSAIIRFALYEELKLRLVKNGEDSQESASDITPSFFLAGLAAGACASATMTPFDVIKTRIATHTAPGNVHTVIGTARAIVSENGINALYAGVGARMVWSGMFSAIGFGMFEICKSHLFPISFDDKEHCDEVPIPITPGK